MSYTITGDSDTVTLNNPAYLVQTATMNVETYIFDDGTDRLLDRGKRTHTLTIHGIETSSVATVMSDINTIMDAQEDVTVAGLDDANLNTEYKISNFNFRRDSGELNRYKYSITLERLYDQL